MELTKKELENLAKNFKRTSKSENAKSNYRIKSKRSKELSKHFYRKSKLKPKTAGGEVVFKRNRNKILKIVKTNEGEIRVKELVRELKELSPRSIRRHLKKLSDEEIIERERINKEKPGLTYSIRLV